MSGKMRRELANRLSKGPTLSARAEKEILGRDRAARWLERHEPKKEGPPKKWKKWKRKPWREHDLGKLCAANKGRSLTPEEIKAWEESRLSE
jgi:hypothetical protein